jgi:hypothetical protein
MSVAPRLKVSDLAKAVGLLTAILIAGPAMGEGLPKGNARDAFVASAVKTASGHSARQRRMPDCPWKTSSCTAPALPTARRMS